MFEMEGMKAVEIIVRIIIVYVSCMVLLRVSGRREMSQLSPMDLVTMLLLSETVSPAMTGGDQTITGGLIAATTLLGCCIATSWIVFKIRGAEELIQGDAVVLIEHGHVRADVLRRFQITSDDIKAALHQHGLLHVREVARAFVESDGDITIVNVEDYEKSRARQQRRAAR